MNDHDTAEIVKILIWKENKKFTIYGIYSPPNNKNLCLDTLGITSATVVIGDLNAAFPSWGYNYYNHAGRTLGEFLNSQKLELLYNPQDKKTFLHYSGSTTNPDLAMVSSDIYENSQKAVLEGLGSSHQAVLITILLKVPTNKPNTCVTWNFRKANWIKFQDQVEIKTSTINIEESAHKILKTFCKMIQQSAKENIPRGKQCKYKPFWTQELNEQKNIRDRARQKAEKSKLQEDVVAWGKEKTQLKHQITQSKRNSWNIVLSKLNYKTDGKKAFKFMNKLNNRYSQKQSQPFKIQDKEITDGKENCKLL